METGKNFLALHEGKVSIKPEVPSDNTLLLIIDDREGKEFEIYMNFDQARVLAEIIELFIKFHNSKKELGYRAAMPQNFIC